MPGKGPSDRALDRLGGYFAIFLRLASTAAAAVAGPLAAVGGVSGYWLTFVLTALSAWAVVFAWAVWRRGPAPALVLADVAVIAVLVSAHQHVVPARAIADGTTWMLPLASTAVFIPQLTLRPLLSLPAAAVTAVTYALSAPHPADASFLVLQTVVTAALMMLVRRGGRSADAVIAGDLRAQQALQAEAARRADEKEQYRQLHDTILSTLTMVGSGAFAARLPMLSAQAARDLQVLRALPEMPGAGPEAGQPPAPSLAERLREAAAAAAPLRVTLRLTAASPPAAVAGQLTACVAEALRNVARHAGVDRAEVSLRTAGDRLVIDVSDRGSGFDPQLVPASRRGIRESIAGRMAAAGGTAAITSSPGQGTNVQLRWPA